MKKTTHRPTRVHSYQTYIPLVEFIAICVLPDFFAKIFLSKKNLNPFYNVLSCYHSLCISSFLTTPQNYLNI